MKKLRLPIIFSLILCCLLILGSCKEKDTLPAPENAEIEPTSLTLTWKKVNDARMYMISITPEGGEGFEVSASKNSYSLTTLDKGNYKIKVKAISKEDDKDSPWSSEISFYREAEPGLVMTLINNGTAYEVTNKGSATGDIVIPDTYRSKPVISVAERAFFNKNDVTSVKLGANVKSIGKFAFCNCSYLTSVSFPEGLLTIGDSAFASCRLLGETLELPGSLESISESAFAYCIGITDVSFGNKLTSIGKSAFTNCTGLLSLDFKSGIKTVGEYAFADCTSLNSIDFGDTVESLGDYSFAGDKALVSVTIPDSVKSIGIGAFEKCSLLLEVDLGDGLTSIDRTAFDETALYLGTETDEFYVDGWFLALKNSEVAVLNLKNDTYGIADYALYANRKITSLILPDSVRIIGYASFAGTALNGVAIGGGVETIGERAFMSCTDLTSVILGSYYSSDNEPDSNLQSIGNYAFQNCTSLTEIKIPETVKTIGTYAFKSSGLEAYAESGVIYAGNWAVGFTDALVGGVIIRSNTVGIANYAFYKCLNINSIELPVSVRTIGRAAFYDCDQLYSVILPDTLEYIDDYTFYGCDSLKIKSLPTMLKGIGRSAFYNCQSSYALDDEDTDSDTLVIPAGVEYIGDFAFYCNGQEAMMGLGEEYPARGIDVVIIGDGVKTIGKNAFYGFVTLKKVVIGNSVVSIGEKAFYKCPSLESVSFGGNVETIGDRAFYKCELLTEVKLPDSLKSIGEYAFYKCEGLSSLDLGDGVGSVGSSAFYGCQALEAVELPRSLTYIGKQAFRGCKALSSVVIHESITTIMDHAFYGCNDLTVYSSLTGAPDGFSSRWNSSYRPVVWGCNLSEDGSYVISLTKNNNTVLNRNSSNKLSDPIRIGYTFGGWGSNSTATIPSHTSENLTDATDGRTLFAIWNETLQ